VGSRRSRGFSSVMSRAIYPSAQRSISRHPLFASLHHPMRANCDTAKDTFEALDEGMSRLQDQIDQLQAQMHQLQTARKNKLAPLCQLLADVLYHIIDLAVHAGYRYNSIYDRLAPLQSFYGPSTNWASVTPSAARTLLHLPWGRCIKHGTAYGAVATCDFIGQDRCRDRTTSSHIGRRRQRLRRDWRLSISSGLPFLASYAVD
jgi:hypothetical protein